MNPAQCATGRDFAGSVMEPGTNVSIMGLAGTLEPSIPVKQPLMALGLDGARPLEVSWTDGFQSSLNAGAIVDG